MCCGPTDTERRTSAAIVPFAVIALAACTLACRSDHKVSPWIEDFRLDSIVPPPDLEQQLQRVDLEMTSEQMVRQHELKGRFSDGTWFVIRSFVGQDPVRPASRHALRVATGHGVILALGPAQTGGATRPTRTELVAALVDGGGWVSGSDLNGDACPDVVVRGEDHTIELWCLMPRGASPYPVRSRIPPDRAIDIDEDGRPELAGAVVLPGPDPIAPSILEVMSFQQGAYRSDTEVVRAWHAREWGRLTAPPPDGGVPASQGRELATAIEAAWHGLRSGRGAEALGALDAVAREHAPLPSGQAQAWVRWRGWLQDLPR